METQKQDMTTKGRFKNRQAYYWTMFLVLIIVFNYFVLNNVIVRNEIIEFLLPFFEKFLHQPEMDIVSISVDVHS